ncbi:DNA helicase [Mycobacterium phage Findley]|uniref:DNA helicase n=1 Tax=Mycobacterium phage Findley TaxID=2015882 RepID=A0A222ZR71_9CAUD|nr:exonuclease [Mycobacterium phage Findley]ASR86802.1 DNA helicase [Mycobacterium phage Findley]
MSASSSFLGLSDDADPRDKPRAATFDSKLLGDLKGVLKRAWAQHPRSQQRAIGPSEVGHPCARRLASTMLELDRVNPEGDPLPAWLGTAGHAKFETAVEHDNDQIVDAWLRDRNKPCTATDRGDGAPIGRWLSERRVTVRGGLTGTCDLYDTWTDTVIDLKFPGSSRFQQYKRNGPAAEYRTQAHLYGRGYRNEGFDVKRVAIWFIPRGGTLSSSFVWSEPYSDKVVDEALDKLDNILLVLVDLAIEEHPERLALVPKVAHDCMFCPFFTTRPDPERPWACEGGK